MAAGAESPRGRVAATVGVADSADGVADSAGWDSGVDIDPGPTPRAREVGAGLFARVGVGL